MPAESANVSQPKHPLYALTSYELKDYRRLLEHSLKDGVIGNAPVAAELRQALDRVLAEEEQRTRIQRCERKGTHYL